MKVTFLLSKDPSVESTGDLTMVKLVIDLARESYETATICLSQAASAPPVPGLVRVAKPVPKPVPLLIDSLRHGRSLVHSRFVCPELIDAVDRAGDTVFAADHCYMAEAVMASRRYTGSTDPSAMLAVSTVVPEAMVWRATRGLIGRIEGPRIVRDELRVARAAYTVGTYDRDEATFYAGQGIARSHFLELTLPAKTQVDVGAAGPRLVFLGDRRWAPNQEAFAELLTLWPRISHGIAGAELAIIGAPDPTVAGPELPAGVTDHGFVDDLDEFLGTCRAMVAPIRTGGGVRVKILDAASRGLPVVGTGPAVGSLDEVLGIAVYDDPTAMVEQSRRYLMDAVAARSAGAVLYETNRRRWDGGEAHASVERWLKP